VRQETERAVAYTCLGSGWGLFVLSTVCIHSEITKFENVTNIRKNLSENSNFLRKPTLVNVHARCPGSVPVHVRTHVCVQYMSMDKDMAYE
jgi:hypothetical protein